MSAALVYVFAVVAVRVAGRRTVFSPEILVRKGRVDLRRAPWTAQLVTSDLESKLRQQGLRDLKDATLVVLEPDGKITVTTADETPVLFRDLAQRAW